MTEPTREASRPRELDPLPLPPADLVPTETPYTKEPLFSKKVMAAWAVAALLVWFAFTFVVPQVIFAVKSEIIEAAQPHRTNTAVPMPPKPPEPAAPAEPADKGVPAPAPKATTAEPTPRR